MSISIRLIFLIVLGLAGRSTLAALPPEDRSGRLAKVESFPESVRQSVRQSIRKCGRILVSAAIDMVQSERRVLEVETGFSWERGVILHDYFGLIAEGDDLGLLAHRVQMLLDLKGGDRVCVTGRLIERAQVSPLIIPDQIDAWIPVADDSQER